MRIQSTFNSTAFGIFLISNKESLFAVPEKKRTRISDIVLFIANKINKDTVSLEQLIERLGDRTFGILLIVISAFNVIPLISMLSGLLVISLGIQLLFGVANPKLPNQVLKKELPAKRVKAALLAMHPKVEKLEKYVKPRWQFTEALIMDRINGINIALLGVIVLLPVPLANLAPAFIIALIGIGLLERDGLVQVVGLILGTINIALMWWVLFL